VKGWGKQEEKDYPRAASAHENKFFFSLNYMKAKIQDLDPLYPSSVLDVCKAVTLEYPRLYSKSKDDFFFE
jgi:hypothetical protein